MEWQMRDKNARKRKMKAAEEGLLSYQERLLQEYRESISEVLIVRSQLLILAIQGIYISQNHSELVL